MNQPMMISHPVGTGFEEFSTVFPVPPHRLGWFISSLRDAGVEPLSVSPAGENYQVIVNKDDAGQAMVVWRNVVGYSPQGRAPMPEAAQDLRRDTNWRVVGISVCAAGALWLGAPLLAGMMMITAGLMFLANRIITSRRLWGAPLAIRWPVFLLVVVVVSAPMLGIVYVYFLWMGR